MSKMNAKKENLEKKEAIREINNNEIENVSGGGAVAGVNGSYVAFANKKDGTTAVGVFNDYNRAQKYVEGFGDKVKLITGTRLEGDSRRGNFLHDINK